jgi:hypothetical protein
MKYRCSIEVNHKTGRAKVTRPCPEGKTCCCWTCEESCKHCGDVPETCGAAEEIVRGDGDCN